MPLRSSSTVSAVSILAAVSLLSSLASLACAKPSSEAPPAASAASAPAAVATPSVPPEPPAPSPAAAETPSAVALAAPPPVVASSAPTPSAASAPATPKPKSRVRVANIGMHIGGGTNEDPTKEPIKKSVAPHFDALGACFAASGAKAGGDFGVDLLIPEAGGKAKVSHPRTTIKGASPDFERCVVSTFEGIDFLKPVTGRSVVSYSLRFTP